MKPNEIDFDYYSLEEVGKRLYPGEPVFILMARDLEAVQVVLSYGQSLVQKHLATQEQFNKGIAALNVATRFSHWQLRNPKKVKLPDMPRTEHESIKCYRESFKKAKQKV